MLARQQQLHLHTSLAGFSIDEAISTSKCRWSADQDTESWTPEQGREHVGYRSRRASSDEQWSQTGSGASYVHRAGQSPSAFDRVRLGGSISLTCRKPGAGSYPL